MAQAVQPGPIPSIVGARPIGLLAAASETSTMVQGNGVALLLPAGFSGGDPSASQTQAILQETAKLFPKQAEILQTFQNDPSILRLLAINFGTPGQPSATPQLVLVAKLPVPPSLSISEIHSQMTEAFGQVLPGDFKLTDHRVATVGGREIAQFTVDASLKGTQLKEVIGLFRQGQDVYQVVYVGSQSETTQFMANFEQMIRSFKAN
jgi:hypothetical protein